MENRAENKVTSHVVKGLIISLVIIVLSLVMRFTKLNEQSWAGLLSTAIFCIAIIWACINYANQMNNAVTFGNVFAHGFKTTAVVTCITFVFTLLSIYVIYPDTKEVALDMLRRKLDENPQMRDEDRDMAVSIYERSFTLITLATVILGTLIAGALASVLGAAFAKKNPPTPFNNPNL